MSLTARKFNVLKAETMIRNVSDKLTEDAHALYHSVPVLEMWSLDNYTVFVSQHTACTVSYCLYNIIICVAGMSQVHEH